MYTAVHPTLARERNQGLERALPIIIGSNVIAVSSPCKVLREITEKTKFKIFNKF